MKSIFFAFLVLFVCSGSAQVKAPSSFEHISAELNNCQSDCENLSYNFKILFNVHEGLNSLDPKIFNNLQSVAEHQANIWGDTIYEGEYAQKGDTELMIVEGVYTTNHLIGYRITYSQTAYETGNCEVNWDEDEPNYDDCSEGVITETSLVSVDFKEWEIDGDSYAQFDN